MVANDQQNTVLCELSQDGRKERAYSAYGHRAVDEAGHGRLAYNGELRELQTGCYVLGNGYRVFNPVLMRFQSPDSWSPFWVGGLNTYTYCLGNPISFRDDSGHVSFAKFLLVFMSGVSDDAARMGANMGTGRSVGSLRRTVQSGSMSTGSPARASGSMANVTENLGGLKLSGRTSRTPPRQTAKSRDPSPDYSSDESVTGATVNKVPSDVPRLAKSKKPRLIKNNYEHNKEHFPEGYNRALKESVPGEILGTHEFRRGALWVTGDMKTGIDPYFGVPTRNRIVRMPDSTKGPRDRFGYNV
jgi:RHS repeat-associated protein